MSKLWRLMRRFTEHFAEHLVPRLQRLITAEAVCIARQVLDYTTAYHTVMAYAGRYGAIHLCDEAYHDLKDWVATELSEQIMRAEEQNSSSFLEYIDRLMLLPAVACV